MDALAQDLGGLGLHTKPKIWTVTWESIVIVLDDSDEKSATEVQFLFQRFVFSAEDY